MGQIDWLLYLRAYAVVVTTLLVLEIFQGCGTLPQSGYMGDVNHTKQTKLADALSDLKKKLEDYKAAEKKKFASD